MAAQFGGARATAPAHTPRREISIDTLAEVRLCPLNPSGRERHAAVARAIEAIRAGGMVILVDDEDRENEGDLVMAADLVTPEAINFMAREGRGPHLPVADRGARRAAGPDDDGGRQPLAAAHRVHGQHRRAGAG